MLSRELSSSSFLSFFLFNFITKWRTWAIENEIFLDSWSIDATNYWITGVNFLTTTEEEKNARRAALLPAWVKTMKTVQVLLL